MSSRTIAILSIASILVLLCLPVPNVNSQVKSPIKIGVVLSLTGGAAAWGEHAKNGIELALTEINSTGGVNGQPIQLVYRDCRTNGNEAARVLAELIDTEKVAAVIGDVTSTCTVPMASIANERRVVLITPGASYPKLSQQNDFVFRYWYSDELEGKQDAWYANKNMGWRKVTTLYLDAYYGQGINEVFVREFNKLEGAIIDQIPFKQDQKDFPAEIRRIVSRDPRPDGIFLVGYVNETAALLKQLNSNKKTSSILILSTQPFNILDIVEKAGGAAENVTFSVPRPPALSNKTAEDFRKAYKAKYGQDIHEKPADFSDSAYDSLKIVVEALRKGAVYGSDIKDALQNQKGFQGAAFGPVDFDQYGDIRRDEFDFKQVRNGHFELVGKAQPAETPKSAGGEAPSSPPGFWHETTVQAIAGIIAGIILLFVTGFLAIFKFGFLARLKYRYAFRIWQWWRWRASRRWFRKRRLFNRSGREIVTLNDYVDILERLRNVIVNRCNNLGGDTKPEIVIFSYTMQLPRDWPLWDVDLQAALQHPTPLERYFTHFAEFKKVADSQVYSVRLMRVIVIDSEGSPSADSRLKDLADDVNSEYFQTYIDLLHTSEQDAYYYVHPRPWPGWLSDSVFYAIRESGTELKWLWGVTTSYNAGEDLIILRLHRLNKDRKGLTRALSLPFEMHSLDELANMVEGKMLRKKVLTSLRKGNDSKSN